MEDIYIIISKYLLGTASPQEEKEIMEWRNADAGHEQEFQELCESWQIAHAGIHPVIPDKERVWGKIMSNLNLVKPVKMYTRRLLYRAVGIAAMLALVLGFSLSLLVSEEEEVGLVSFTAPVGQKAEVSLPDGTKVWLNSGTKLRYPVKFTGDVRFVELSGEAYFDVKRDEALPFVVKTSRSEVMVLGTEFCVKDYVNQVNQTTLVSGSVSVKDFRGQSYVIVPGQQVCIDQDSSRMLEVETLYFTSWKDGYFMFDQATLERIMDELARWYNFDYFFANAEARNMMLTARIKKYDNIDTVLDILSRTGDIRFSRKGNTITIVSR